MSRIRKAYEARFQWLMELAGARAPERAAEAFLQRARALSSAQHLPLAESLRRVYDTLAAKKPFREASVLPPPTRFWCDAGLGGLARWLRAAGYEAAWEADIDDSALVRKARASGATILTTDSMLMERRVVRQRVVPALWLPPTLKLEEQLRLVFREFRLQTRTPRCMSCGGELRAEDKERLRERIPPKTFRWLDRYFVCAGCGKLFWHGTHWQRIQAKLDHVDQP